RFGGGIHRRGVDERGAGVEEGLQHIAQRRSRRLLGAYLEGPRRPEPDGWQRFAAGGNAPQDQLTVRRRGGSRLSMRRTSSYAGVALLAATADRLPRVRKFRRSIR